MLSMFRRAGTSSLLTAQSYGRCPRALTIPQVQVLDGVRRGQQAPHCGDIATFSALWFRQLATTEWRRFPQRSSAASKLPARRMALISRANFLRSLSRQRLGAWRIGCAMQVSTGDVSVERRPRPPVEIPQGHPPPLFRTGSQETAARASRGLRPGGANGLRTRTVSRTCPSCKSSVNRIRQALAWAAAAMSESHHEIRKHS